MSNPAFIVEGEQERKIVKKLCGNCPIPKIGNGDDFQLSTIADKICDHIKSFGTRYYPIFVIFDREQRVESVDDIVSTIRDILNKNQVTDEVVIGIPDRSLESWIMPFIDEEGSFIPDPIKNCDGEKWKNNLNSKILRGNKKGKNEFRAYHETGSGVDMFIKYVKPEKLAEVSPSFKKFYVETKKRLPNCRWFK